MAKFGHFYGTNIMSVIWPTILQSLNLVLFWITVRKIDKYPETRTWRPVAYSIKSVQSDNTKYSVDVVSKAIFAHPDK